MPSETKTSVLGDVIKLGIDVHKNSYVVAMKIDGSAPERPRRMSPEAFLAWVLELKGRCRQIYSCYETGCFGFELHRKLVSMGVVSHVIRPVNWNEHGKRVKTDKRDAIAMVLCLDGYLRGNERSFSVVDVPTREQERRRSLARQRSQLISVRQRASAQARSSALYHGESVQGEWWRPSAWKALLGRLEDYLLALLEVQRRIILAVEEQIGRLEERIEEMEQPALPRGMGTTLFQAVELEVRDWTRFDSAKKVSSYTGLCPSEDSSADRRLQGSVTKHGNPRLRRSLIEIVWLLLRWNSGYRGVEKWRRELESPKLTKARKKRIVVAIARQFAVDWWRVRTGRIRPEELGLEMKQAKAAA